MKRCVLAALLGIFGCDESAGEECPDAARSGSLAAPSRGVAHGDEHDCVEPLVGPESGAVCPAQSTLTYDNFGKAFMESYCVRCHSSALTDAARNGAPLYHDFDSYEGILAVAEHVDQKAAAGPESTNEAMPPEGPAPTAEERQQLGEWLACELEAM